MTTTPADQLPPEAVAAFWVDQVAAALAHTTAQTAAPASAWRSFTGWYSAAAVAGMAQEMAATSLAAQEMAAGTVTEYIGQVVAALRGDPRILVPPVHVPVIRNGVDLEQVHARPAREFRLELWRSGEEEAAIQAAFDREVALIEADMMLAAREAEVQAMRELQVTRYRRVLRPELSKTGSCLLCMAASLQTYTTDQLMPLHQRCKCRTMPIIDGHDPAEALNHADRERVYQQAGTADRQALSNQRIHVDQHGEYGPVLTVQGQHFEGPGERRRKTPRDVDARRTTDQLRDTLNQLEQAHEKYPTDGLRRRIDDLSRKIANRDTGDPNGGSVGGSGGGKNPPAPPSGGDGTGGGDGDDGEDPFEGVPRGSGQIRYPDLSKLTDDEKINISWYASAGHERINQALRGQIPMTDDLQTEIDNIRSGLRKYPLGETIRVTRETDLLDAFGLASYDEIDSLVGRDFTEAAFMSTSFLLNPPRFARGRLPVWMDIVVPAGTPALAIVEDLALDDLSARTERELLLIDARYYRVRAVRWDDRNRRWRIYVAIEGQ